MDTAPNPVSSSKATTSCSSVYFFASQDCHIRVQSECGFHSLTIVRQLGIRMIFEGLVFAAVKGIVRAREACLIAENIIKLLRLSERKVVDASGGVRCETNNLRVAL
jgi:hypothetical protein